MCSRQREGDPVILLREQNLREAQKGSSFLFGCCAVLDVRYTNTHMAKFGCKSFLNYVLQLGVLI